MFLNYIDNKITHSYPYNDYTIPNICSRMSRIAFSVQ